MAKLRQEITLNNAVLTASANNYVLLTPENYDSATFFFEVVGRVASGTLTVSLRRVGTTTDDATLTFTETAYTRKRTAAFTPLAGGVEYFIFMSGGTTPQVNAGRVIILQSKDGQLGFTEAQIEIGNIETGKVNTASAALTNPKYWKYESDAWDAGTTFQAEVVWRGNSNMANTTITLQQDNGSFGSWANVVTLESARVGTVTVLRTRLPFTPTNGRHYRIAAFNSSNMTSYDIFSARVVVNNVSFFLAGSGLSISGADTPALAALSSTRVAFIDLTNRSLRAYDFNGSTWSLVGSGLSISGAGVPTLAALSGTRVAFIDSENDSLRAYDFNGSTWSLVGSGLSITGNVIPALAALSSTRVAFIDSGNDSLRAYDFNGSTWSLVGSGLSISGVGTPALAALSSTRVAFIDSGNDSLRAYDFNGSTWSLVGSGLSISGAAQPALAALSSTRVVFIDAANDSLRAYDFNGSTWSLVGSGLSISGVGVPTLAALSGTRVAFIDSANDSLRAYDFNAAVAPITKHQPQYLLANTGSFGGATGLKDYDTLFDPAEWSADGGTIDYYHEGNGVTSGTGDMKLQQDPNGTPIDVLSSAIIDVIEVERSQINLDAWTQEYTGTFAYGSGSRLYCKLTEDTIAVYSRIGDNVNGVISTYKIVNGAWVQIGNEYTTAYNYADTESDITLLRNNVIVIAYDFIGLQTYEFNGTDWIELGNRYQYLNAPNGLNICKIDTNKIAQIEISRITIFSFDETEWTIENTFSISLTDRQGAVCYETNKFSISFRNMTTGVIEIKSYYYNGTTIEAIGTDFSMTRASGSGTVVYSTLLNNSTMLIAVGGTIQRVFRFKRTGDTWIYDNEILAVNFRKNICGLNLNRFVGSTTANTNVIRSYYPDTSARTIDVNVTGTGTLNASRIIVNYSWDEDTGSYILLLNKGTYNLNGKNVDLKISYKQNLEKGNFTLTGGTLDFVKAYFMLLQKGVYELNGAPLHFILQYVQKLFKGSYVLSGKEAEFKQQYLMALNSGSYSLTGNEISFINSFIMFLESGQYQLQGAATNLLADFYILAEKGEYQLFGKELQSALQYILSLEKGNYSLEGKNVESLVQRLLRLEKGSYQKQGKQLLSLISLYMSLEQGTYTLTGKNLSFLQFLSISLQKGIYNFSGKDIDLIISLYVALNKGNYEIDGKNLEIIKSYIIALEKGLLTVTGADLSVVKQNVLQLEKGTYTYVGFDLEMIASYITALNKGLLSLDGKEAAIIASRIAKLNKGGYILQGKIAEIRAYYVVQAEKGEYVITGKNALIGDETIGINYIFTDAVNPIIFIGSHQDVKVFLNSQTIYEA